jgi:single-stranded DNA-binding protein
MISIFASGFIPAKPELLLVGNKRRKKCDFTVVDSRRAWVDGGWETVWERVVFVAWDEEAEKVASMLDKGTNVSCTGVQETSKWSDGSGQTRQAVKYRLTAWQIDRRGRAGEGSDTRDSQRQDSAHGGAADEAHHRDRHGAGASAGARPSLLEM